MFHGKFTNSLDISKYFELNYRSDGEGVDVFNLVGRPNPLQIISFNDRDTTQFTSRLNNLDSLNDFEGGFIFDRNVQFTNSFSGDEGKTYNPYTNNFSNKYGWKVRVGSQNETNPKTINKVVAYGIQTWYIGGEITLSNSSGQFNILVVDKELGYRQKAHGDILTKFRRSTGNGVPGEITEMDRAITNNEEMYFFIKGLYFTQPENPGFEGPGFEHPSGYRTDFIRMKFDD